MNSEYKGLKIDFNRHGNIDAQFEVDDIGGKYSTIDKAEAAIDRHIKNSRKIERIPVLFGNDHWGGSESFKPAEITSITEDGSVWVSDANTNRTKQSPRQFICLNNTENNVILSKVLDMRAKAKTLTKEADELMYSTDRAKIDELIKKLKVD